MQNTFRNLLKHSSIYGSGQILSRLASFLLLPVYTAYLSPADYGVMAILDFTAGFLGILLGRSIIAAINRYHFEARDETERDQVWWTGLTFLILIATAIVGPALLFRDLLARLTLGSTLSFGGYYYILVLVRLWFGTLGQLPNSYLRVQKRSGIYISIALGRLLLNVALNLFFLVVLKLGIEGILLGNLISGIVHTVFLLMLLKRSRGPYVIHRPLIRPLWQFGGPIIGAAFLSFLMHQADRYLLRLFLNLEQVGLYSLAYMIGQAINTLVLVPFSSIWSVEMYEIAAQHNAKYVYAQVFQYFVYGLLLVMLGVSLFALPLLTLIAAPAYTAAAHLIPIVCLAYVFFSLHEHFRVPAMLAKKTLHLLPAYLIAAAVNLGANLLMIPLWGTRGAAWASVLTFATFSFVGLWRYRQIDRYEYPLVKCGLVLLGMVMSYVACSWGSQQLSPAWSLGLAICTWLVWAVALLAPFAWRFIVHSIKRKASKAVAPQDHTIHRAESWEKLK